MTSKNLVIFERGTGRILKTQRNVRCKGRKDYARFGIEHRNMRDVGHIYVTEAIDVDPDLHLVRPPGKRTPGGIVDKEGVPVRPGWIQTAHEGFWRDCGHALIVRQYCLGDVLLAYEVVDSIVREFNADGVSLGTWLEYKPLLDALDGTAQVQVVTGNDLTAGYQQVLSLDTTYEVDPRRDAMSIADLFRWSLKANPVWRKFLPKSGREEGNQAQGDNVGLFVRTSNNQCKAPGADWWLKLYELLRSDFGINATLYLGPWEADECRAFPDDACEYSDCLSLLAAMKGVDTYIGVDTGTMHVARLLNLPGVAMFGPTRPELRLERYDQLTPIVGPCDTPGCYPETCGKPRCHDKLPAEEVAHEIASQLKTYDVSVIIPTRYAGKSLARAIETTSKALGGLDAEFIVTAEPQTEPLDLQPLTPHPVTTIKHTAVRGFGGSITEGVRRARGELILLLNDDAWYLDGPLEETLREWFAKPGGWLAGYTILVPDGTEIWHAGKIFGDFPLMLHRGSQLPTDDDNFRKVEPVVGVCFCVVLMPRWMYWQCEGLDERFGLGYCEDDDFCNRARSLGYTVWLDGRIRWKHQGGTSFAKLGRGIIDDARRESEETLRIRWKNSKQLAHP